MLQSERGKESGRESRNISIKAAYAGSFGECLFLGASVSLPSGEPEGRFAMGNSYSVSSGIEGTGFFLNLLLSSGLQLHVIHMIVKKGCVWIPRGELCVSIH